MWARDNGYIPSGNPAPEHRYEWERHGNPEQWIDVRWSREEIERHHREYVITSTLARLDRESRDRIWADLEGQI
jgi:hypothetical protein